MEKIELEREKEKLKKTIKIIGEILEDENLDLKKLYTDFVGDREELWRIADRKKIHITNLETALDKPYFARIDFKSEEDGKVSTVYIGKNGDKEIDFVAAKRKDRLYIQVCRELPKESDREITNLMEIKDHYPKLVVTLDDFASGNFNGIKIISLIDFLLDKNQY